MANPVTILILSHSATLTGAPLQLLSLLRKLKSTTDWQIVVLLRNGGQLERDFAAICPTYLASNGTIASSVYFDQPLSSYSGLRQFFDAIRPNLVYSNTVTNGYWVRLCQRCKLPVVLHVHETETAFKYYTRKYRRETLQSHHFICVSRHVQDYLINQYAVPLERSSIIHCGIDLEAVIQGAHEAPQIRQQLGIADHAIIIGGVGWMSLQKGVDLWLQMARRVAEKASDLHPVFLWVGSNQDNYAQEMARDAALMGLKDSVIFTGQVSNPYPYINLIDILVSSSRYESFGLAIAEAAALGKPVVYFEASGGPSEIVDSTMGIAVKALDAYEMGDCVRLLAANKEVRRVLGENGRRRIASDFRIEDKANQVKLVVETVLGEVLSTL